MNKARLRLRNATVKFGNNPENVVRWVQVIRHEIERIHG
jgi:hypothetical protein